MENYHLRAFVMMAFKPDVMVTVCQYHKIDAIGHCSWWHLQVIPSKCCFTLLFIVRNLVGCGVRVCRALTSIFHAADLNPCLWTFWIHPASDPGREPDQVWATLWGLWAGSAQRVRRHGQGFWNSAQGRNQALFWVGELAFGLLDLMRWFAVETFVIK